MQPTGMPCSRCGKKDDEIDLEADLVSGLSGQWYVLLLCKDCMRKNSKSQITLKYNYRIPVYLPEDKAMKVVISKRQIPNEVKQE